MSISSVGKTPSPKPPIPESVAHKRLHQKLEQSSFLPSGGSARTNWSEARLLTPGGLFGYRDEKGLRYLRVNQTGSVQFFRSGQESQGLILEKGQAVGTSVTSKIQTETKRKDEAKGTFIQYDKNRVEQDGADFEVDSTNYRGWVNYQGGHLIDHKFSAGTSHYEEKNYFPAHYFYNAPLKEYLVQGCDAYVEIPIYTPNPPKIGVKGEADNYHPIPIGVVLVQISENAIQDAYYFPNNNFDYKGLKDELGLTKDLAKNMAPYFKLDSSLHRLFRAAMIIDTDHVEGGISKQWKREKAFFEAMDDLSTGMSLAECGEEQELISQIAFSVLQEESLDPSLCFDCDEDQLETLKNQPIEQPLQALGEFLVRYGIKNALKSEFLSIRSRLIFVNVIIDFIEGYQQVGDSALNFVEGLAEEFKSTLEELIKLDPMHRKELFYLTQTYGRLCDSSIQDSGADGNFELYDLDDIEPYLNTFIHLLKRIAKKYPIDSLTHDETWNFLDFAEKAQDTIDYLIDHQYPEESFDNHKKFLKDINEPAQQLLSKQPQKNGQINVTFQTNIQHVQTKKAIVSYLEAKVKRLGS